MANFTVIATKQERLKDLIVANGQLIFCQDTGRIAFDFNNKRVFYNQIHEIDTEYERASISEPMIGYYFVIDSACLWRYDKGWTQITSSPESKDIVFIGVEMPELGQAKTGTLYVNKAEKEISIYDEDINEYVVVSNRTNEITNEDIESLFN